MARILLLKDPLHLVLGLLRALLRMLSSPSGTARNQCTRVFTARQTHLGAETSFISPKLYGRTLLRLDVPCKLARLPTRSFPACSPGSPSAITTPQAMWRASTLKTSLHLKRSMQTPVCIVSFLISIACWLLAICISGAPEAHSTFHVRTRLAVSLSPGAGPQLIKYLDTILIFTYQ